MNIDELAHYIRSAKIDMDGNILDMAVPPFDVRHLDRGVYELRMVRIGDHKARPTVVVTAHTDYRNANATAFQTTDDILIVRICEPINVPIDCAFDIVVTFPF